MKIFVTTVLAAMLASGAAYAQNNNQNNNHGPNNHGPNNQGANNHGPAQPNAHPAPQAHPGPAMMSQSHGAPAVPARNMGGGRPGPGPGRHHLPPGISIPTARHSAPNWRGRSWGIGDTFILTGFRGPTIRDWSGYALDAPRPGTHWIYVDGYYLLIGNRTGRIFAEVAADY